MANRKSVTLDTYNRILKYLQKQKDFIFKSQICKDLNIDYDSMNVAIIKMDVKINSDGKVRLIK